MSVVKNCSRLREYETLIELMENSDKNDPEACSKVISAALKRGLLHGYLERKTTEVFNLLTTEYSYEEDIAAKTEEALEKGISEGMKEGSKSKTYETVLRMLNMNIFTTEQIAQANNISIEEVEKIQQENNI